MAPIAWTKREIVAVLNSWDPSIKVKEKDVGVGTDLHILDLDFNTVKYVKGLELINWSRMRNVMQNFRPRFSVGKTLFRHLYNSTWLGGRE
eukprot:TRINITY_DN128881_c0_g1_i1.p1 TRINITY_DN128881_c0_g1~~TRINITY_DN128881_c0_g1_i1.p1  ORF type:complete len:100 (+),score=25.52 TRINITY_DN128881_c0_g1_i1:30-302(+)